MFSRVWETERLVTDSHLNVSKDRENSNGEPDLEFDQKRGVNFPHTKYTAWEVAGFQGCKLGQSITFFGEQNNVWHS